MGKIIKKVRQFLQIEYPFEVLYTDGSRSWVPQENKKPWGVFFGKGVISLNDEADEVQLEQAIKSTQKLSTYTITCGSKKFWEDVCNQPFKTRNKLNDFLEQLGGKKISGFYWTNTDRQSEEGYAYYFYNNYQGIIANNKYIHYKLRPVIEN